MKRHNTANDTLLPRKASIAGNVNSSRASSASPSSQWRENRASINARPRPRVLSTNDFFGRSIPSANTGCPVGFANGIPEKNFPDARFNGVPRGNNRNSKQVKGFPYPCQPHSSPTSSRTANGRIIKVPHSRNLNVATSTITTTTAVQQPPATPMKLSYDILHMVFFQHNGSQLDLRSVALLNRIWGEEASVHLYRKPKLRELRHLCLLVRTFEEDVLPRKGNKSGGGGPIRTRRGYADKLRHLVIDMESGKETHHLFDKLFRHARHIDTLDVRRRAPPQWLSNFVVQRMHHLKSVRRLRLVGRMSLADSVLERCLEKWRGRLTHLALEEGILSAEGVIKLLDVLDPRALKSLSLGEGLTRYVTDSVVKHLAAVPFTGLETLCLKGSMMLTTEGLKSLGQENGWAQRTLQSLFFHQVSSVESSGFQDLVQKLPKLRHLHFVECSLDSTDLNKIIDVLPVTMKTLAVVRCEGVSAGNTLELVERLFHGKNVGGQEGCMDLYVGREMSSVVKTSKCSHVHALETERIALEEMVFGME